MTRSFHFLATLGWHALLVFCALTSASVLASGQPQSLATTLTPNGDSNQVHSSAGLTIYPTATSPRLKAGRVSPDAIATLSESTIEIELAQPTIQQLSEALASKSRALVSGVVLPVSRDISTAGMRATIGALDALPEKSVRLKVRWKIPDSSSATFAFNPQNARSDDDVTIQIPDGGTNGDTNDFRFSNLLSRMRARPDAFPSGVVWLGAPIDSHSISEMSLVGSKSAILNVIDSVTHYVYGTARIRTSETSLGTDSRKSFEACLSDVACTPKFETSATRATVRIEFIDHTSGRRLTCSGTLVTDERGSGLAYLLTANHCMPTQAEAESLTIFWNDQIETCSPSSGTSTNYLVLPGGADLVYAGGWATTGGVDISLLGLRVLPSRIPVSFAPWSTVLPPTGTSVFGVHHPHSLEKKASLGTVSSYIRCISIDQCDNAREWPQTVRQTWTSAGLSGPGSSGSGLFLDTSGALFGVASIATGNPACGVHPDTDVYTQNGYALLETVWSGVAPFLSPPIRPLDTATLSGITDMLVADQSCSLDIDGDGTVRADTDGLLLLRTLLGFSGSAVTNGALGTPSAGSSLTRGTWPLIKAHVDDMRASLALDLDGDSKVDAMREGLIFLRAMLGLSAQTTLNGLGLPTSAWPTISSRLRENCGLVIQ